MAGIGYRFCTECSSKIYTYTAHPVQNQTRSGLSYKSSSGSEQTLRSSPMLNV